MVDSLLVGWRRVVLPAPGHNSEIDYISGIGKLTAEGGDTLWCLIAKINLDKNDST
jgi:hypothetical protein